MTDVEPVPEPPKPVSRLPSGLIRARAKRSGLKSAGLNVDPATTSLPSPWTATLPAPEWYDPTSKLTRPPAKVESREPAPAEGLDTTTFRKDDWLPSPSLSVTV